MANNKRTKKTKLEVALDINQAVDPVMPPLETLPVEAFTGTHCVVDGREIKVQAFKGTGTCSELCRKYDSGEISEEEYYAARGNQAS